MVQDAIGMAPILGYEDKSEQVLKRIAIWKRPRARYHIKQNKAADAWFPEAKPDLKRRPKTGFDVGTVEELIAQGRAGGVRVPGTVSVKEGELHAITDTDLVSVLPRGSRIRIKNITFFLDKKGKFDAETIPLSKVWWRQDINDAQLYLMPPLSLAGRLYHYILDLAFYNQLTQGLVIGQYIAGNVKLANMMTKLAKKLRKAGFRKTANSLKSSAKTLEGYAQRAKYLTTMHMKILRAGNLAEKKVDPNASLSVEALAAKKDAEREAAYLSAGGKKKKWEVKFDEEALKKCVSVLIFSRVASCRLRCALCHYGRRTDARASQVLGQHGHGRGDV